MTIVEFLTARIAEDEAYARNALGLMGIETDWHEVANLRERGLSRADAQHVNRWSSRRVLAECQAKRALIKEVLRVGSQVDGVMGCCHEPHELRQDSPPPGAFSTGCPGAATVQDLLVPLAAVYADHPDYREEWRT